MDILWRNSDKTPATGDIKILKDGSMFIRGRHLVKERGQIMWNRTGGRDVYVWFPFKKNHGDLEPSCVDRARQEYLEKGTSIFRATSATRIQKTKTIVLDMKVEADRQRYMKYFNRTSIDSNIDKITLSVAA